MDEKEKKKSKKEKKDGEKKDKKDKKEKPDLTNFPEDFQIGGSTRYVRTVESSKVYYVLDSDPENTEHKWKSLLDPKGKLYFQNASTSKTSWKLPAVAGSAAASASKPRDAASSERAVIGNAVGDNSALGKKKNKEGTSAAAARDSESDDDQDAAYKNPNPISMFGLGAKQTEDTNTNMMMMGQAQGLGFMASNTTTATKDEQGNEEKADNETTTTLPGASKNFNRKGAPLSAPEHTSLHVDPFTSDSMAKDRSSALDTEGQSQDHDSTFQNKQEEERKPWEENAYQQPKQETKSGISTSERKTAAIEDQEKTYYLKQRLIDFCETHCPHRLPTVDYLMREYEGREEELFDYLYALYPSEAQGEETEAVQHGQDEEEYLQHDLQTTQSSGGEATTRKDNQIPVGTYVVPQQNTDEERNRRHDVDDDVYGEPAYDPMWEPEEPDFDQKNQRSQEASKSAERGNRENISSDSSALNVQSPPSSLFTAGTGGRNVPSSPDTVEALEHLDRRNIEAGKTSEISEIAEQKGKELQLLRDREGISLMVQTQQQEKARTGSVTPPRTTMERTGTPGRSSTPQSIAASKTPREEHEAVSRQKATRSPQRKSPAPVSSSSRTENETATTADLKKGEVPNSMASPLYLLNLNERREIQRQEAAERVQITASFLEYQQSDRLRRITHSRSTSTADSMSGVLSRDAQRLYQSAMDVMMLEGAAFCLQSVQMYQDFVRTSPMFTKNPSPQRTQGTDERRQRSQASDVPPQGTSPVPFDLDSSSAVKQQQGATAASSLPSESRANQLASSSVSAVATATQSPLREPLTSAPVRNIFTPVLPVELRRRALEDSALLEENSFEVPVRNNVTRTFSAASPDPNHRASPQPPALVNNMSGSVPAIPVSRPVAPPVRRVETFLQWDPKRSGPCVFSHDATMAMAHRSKRRASEPQFSRDFYAIGTVGVSKGQFVYEVRVDLHPLADATSRPFSVGVASKYFRGPLGKRCACYLYRCDGAITSFSDEQVGVRYGERLRSGSVVTVHLDLTRWELSFYVDGVCQGVAFRFTPIAEPEPLFPVVVFSGEGDTVTLQPPTAPLPPMLSKKRNSSSTPRRL